MSSVPQNNITVIQGEDSTLLELQWLDSDSVAIDLTGSTAFMQIRTSEKGALLLDRSIGNGITITNNTFIVSLSALESQSIINTSGSGVYDFFVVDSLGKRKKLISGTVTLESSVTTSGISGYTSTGD